MANSVTDPYTRHCIHPVDCSTSVPSLGEPTDDLELSVPRLMEQKPKGAVRVSILGHVIYWMGDKNIV